MFKCKYLLVSLLTFLLFTTSVRAVTCSYEQRAQLNSEISNISASYEVLVRRELSDTPPDELLGTEEEDNYYSETDYFQINILNLTENVYVVVTNDYDNTVQTYQYSDTTDGNIAIDWNNVMEITKFTISVYASDYTGCSGTLLRTITLQLPRYNDYSELALCDSVSDYYLCQRYVTFEEIDFGTFVERVQNQIASVEAAEEEEEASIASFFIEHWVQIVIGLVVVIVIAGGTVVIIKYKKRGERKNEKN